MADLVAQRKAAIQAATGGRAVRTIRTREQVISARHPEESKPPREVWGTSSLKYGEVSLTGEVVRTPEQVAQRYGGTVTRPTPTPTPTQAEEAKQSLIRRESSLELARQESIRQQEQQIQREKMESLYRPLSERTIKIGPDLPKKIKEVWQPGGTTVVGRKAFAAYGGLRKEFPLTTRFAEAAAVGVPTALVMKRLPHSLSRVSAAALEKAFIGEKIKEVAVEKRPLLQVAKETTVDIVGFMMGGRAALGKEVKPPKFKAQKVRPVDVMKPEVRLKLAEERKPLIFKEVKPEPKAAEEPLVRLELTINKKGEFVYKRIKTERPKLFVGKKGAFKSPFAILEKAYKKEEISIGFEKPKVKQYVLVEEEVFVGAKPTEAKIGRVYPVIKTETLVLDKQTIKQKQVQQQQKIQKQATIQILLTKQIQKQQQKQKQLQVTINRQIQKTRLVPEKTLKLTTGKYEKFPKFRPIKQVKPTKKKKGGYVYTLWGTLLPKIPARKSLAEQVFSGVGVRPMVKFPKIPRPNL